MQEVIRKTYFPNLDLAASGPVLAQFEHATPRALNERREPVFFKRLGLAIDQFEVDYDVVVIDCPAQLGFLTMSALIAATIVLNTVIPSMPDIASMNQFLQMTAGLSNIVSNHAAPLEYDHLKVLITRFEPSDEPQAQMAGFLRAFFTDQVMMNTFLKSTAVSDARLTVVQSLWASRPGRRRVGPSCAISSKAMMAVGGRTLPRSTGCLRRSCRRKPRPLRPKAGRGSRFQPTCPTATTTRCEA